MDAVIMRSQAMAEINSGRPFNLEFVTADRRRGTGGELISCRGWMRVREDLPETAFRARFRTAYRRMKNTRQTGNRKSFVIYNPANPATHPITVHYWLMQTLNGKRIING